MRDRPAKFLPASPSPTTRRLRVLIVEDSITAAAAIEAALRADGMDTERAPNGADAITLKEAFDPDVILVDLELPDVSGMSLVEHFARDRECAIIAVTAYGEEQRRLFGLSGADDYVVKPPVSPDLAQRIRWVHRRGQRGRREAAVRDNVPPRVLIDAVQQCLVGPGPERTPLTDAELAALETLIDADGACVSRAWLSRVALRRPARPDDRSVDQLVLKLRRKLAGHVGAQRTILTARRQGYVIADPSCFNMLAGRLDSVTPAP